MAMQTSRYKWLIKYITSYSSLQVTTVIKITVTLAFPPIDLFTYQEMDDKTKSSERIVLEPYEYLLQLPGKSVVCLVCLNPVITSAFIVGQHIYRNQIQLLLLCVI